MCSPGQSQSQGQAEENILNLDAGDQNLLLRTLVHEGRCFSVDGQEVLRICNSMNTHGQVAPEGHMIMRRKAGRHCEPCTQIDIQTHATYDLFIRPPVRRSGHVIIMEILQGNRLSRGLTDWALLIDRLANDIDDTS